MNDTLEPDDGKKSTRDGSSSDCAEDQDTEQTSRVSTGVSLEKLAAQGHSHLGLEMGKLIAVENNVSFAVHTEYKTVGV